jgi:hypothetical protein
LRQNAQTLFLLTKDGKESMSIRDVTFEELLAMLRRSPKLVAKKKAAENSDCDKAGHADIRELPAPACGELTFGFQ